MAIYLYVGSGYNKGGWLNYKKITVARGPERCKSWRNKKMQVLYRSDKLYCGSTLDCAFERTLAELRLQYPNMQEKED